MSEAGEATEVFLASRNAKKLAEMQRILQAHLPGVRVLGLDDVPAYPEPVEDQPDFAGNARLKARAGLTNTGLPSVADDSGICVDALSGMPGVLSARWAGHAKDDAANNALLLDQLHDVPDERRGAAFRCVVVCALPGGEEISADGEMRGRVIREQRGTDGFGYDVVFVPEETDDDRTSAELAAQEKDAISHRGKALRLLAPQLAAALTR